MLNTIKSLVAKSWKNSEADLEPGRHYIDEEFVVRVHGRVEKLDDETAIPTVSIPLITTLAYFWDRLGVDRNEALVALREALHEAMSKGVKEDTAIKSRIEDVQQAVATIRKELIADLPPLHRAGKVITSDLTVELVPAGALSLAAA
jgi:hypothetical protein